ncbi:MAG: SIMPL domain-containing protein [Planctomycetaceae bacterium]
MRHFLHCCWFTAAAMICSQSFICVAFAEGRVVQVTGVGEVEARPTMVELSGLVKGEGELASDAVVKYRGNRRRAIEAIEALAIEGLTIDGGGVSIQSTTMGGEQMAMFGNGNAALGVQQLAVSEPIRIRIAGIDKLSTEELIGLLVRVVDAGKDAGINVGGKSPSMMEMQLGITGEKSIATFTLGDVDALEKSASQAAIADARKRAETLSELSGIKLGNIVGIRAVTPKEDNDSQDSMQGYYAMIYGIMNSERKKEGYSSSELRPISVKAAFQVDFEILPN